LFLGAASFTPLQLQIIEILNEPRGTDEIIRILNEDASRVTTTLIEMELLGHLIKQGDKYRTSF